MRWVGGGKLLSIFNWSPAPNGFFKQILTWVYNLFVHFVMKKELGLGCISIFMDGLVHSNTNRWEKHEI